jgi:hypothetical protein
MRRRASVLALALCPAVVLLVSTVSVLPAAAGEGGTRDVSGMRALLDIWCMADGSCLGVGYTPQNVGAVVTLRAEGPSGPVREVPGTVKLSGIACHQGGSCIAVGQGQRSGMVVDVSLDGTPGPVRPVAGATDLYEVACPTATTCLATGSVLNRQYPLYLNPTTLPVFTVIRSGKLAAAQRFPRGARRMIGIACPTATTCLATGNDAVAVLSDAGGTWSARVNVVSGSLATGYPTDAINCLSATACYATAAGFILADDGYVGVPAVVSVSLTGTVGRVQLLGHESGVAADISCASGRTCTVVGQDNLAIEGLVIDFYRGIPAPAVRWADANFFGAASCLAPGTCGIVGSSPGGAVFAWHGPLPG